jgi:beta-glucanase (GH16 family)
MLNIKLIKTKRAFNQIMKANASIFFTTWALAMWVITPFFVHGQTPDIDNNWQSTPFFEDEFSGYRFWTDNREDNTHKWRAFFLDSGVLHDIYEHQAYQRENAIFNSSNSGSITLKAEYKNWDTNYWRPAGYFIPNSMLPRAFFSGAIESTNQFKYGYFEIKCALPDPSYGNLMGYGNFPAFWLWSSFDPEYNEIDVFEHIIRSLADTISDTTELQNPALDSLRFTSKYQRYYSKEFVAVYTISEGELPLNQMHTYAVEWAPHFVIFYFDGKQTCSAIYDTEIPVQPMAIRINFAIDNWIRAFDTLVTEPWYYTYPAPRIVSATFPREMKVDYVKVFKLKCDCETNLNITTTYQLNNTVAKVRKNITIGNPSQTILAQNANISLRATNAITINGNFEVPLGKSFYAITHPCPCEDQIPE